ncbi:MAG TPA: hypothetical protein VMU99_06540 [Acidimicrobiales bacterium]|nr:hypothetical protein [Acidimicrobiales bacterium]
MTDPSGNGQDIFERLARDPYFRKWTDVSGAFSREDIEEAIALVLGAPARGLPSLPGAQERAMARLALYQVVAHHLEEAPMSWADLFGRLSAQEITEVEQILGAMSLRELFE